MNDILTRDPNDTGDIPLGIGEERTVILRRDTTGETTQNIGALAAEMDGLPPRRRPAAADTAEMRLIEPALGLNHHDMARVIEMDETVIYCDPDWPSRVDGELEGPQKPPPPLPPPLPKYDMADAQPVWPLERVAGAEVTQVQSLWYSMTATVDGELRPIAPTLNSAPVPNPRYVGRHRRSSWFTPLVEVYAVVYARIRGAM